ncbi:MAG: response regulator transcription factor [Bacteroidetes bacterium]|nr:response regulator transcription factor [Bacteroidota bacterium]
MKNVKVAIADDHTMFRSGLAMILNDMEGIKVVIEATDGKDLIAKLRGTKVNLVFLDYRMPEMNGITAARIIRESYADLRILMLSSYDEEEIIMSSFASGVNGFLTKGDNPAEIAIAIESVMTTGYYFNDRTSKLAIINMTAQNKITPRFDFGSAEVKLSAEEIMVIRLLAKELSTREIAGIMLKSERTVDAYRAKIMKKTGTKNLAGIIMYGVKYGIIEV